MGHQQGKKPQNKPSNKQHPASATGLRKAARVDPPPDERLTVGHDLRNPLNAILMAAGLLVIDDRLDEKQATLAERILTSARRMRQMLDELTRPPTGPVELDAVEADLGVVCTEVAAELRMATSAAIDVRVFGVVAGKWDVHRLSRAISNIASNAVEHARPNTSVHIDVEENDGVYVRISNEGEPIARDLLPTIFEPFCRGPHEDRTREHLGMGLYIAREVVHAHGGTLTVACEDGVTTFTLHLPR